MKEPPLALERVSTVEALERALRQRILDGDLAPGMWLRESDIAAAYGVGRHTVRAAFQGLAYKGLAAYERNRGVSVIEPTAEVVRDIYTFRAAIEAEAVRLIIERGESLGLVRLRVEDLMALPASASWSELIERDLAVHEAILATCGSPSLCKAFQTMKNQVLLFLSSEPGHHYLVDITNTRGEHADVLAALESGDSARAVEVVRKHLYDMIQP